MGAVGDEGEVEAVGEGECALDDVVVSVHEHGAAVAEVSEECEAGVDSGSELVEGGVGMSGGGVDVVRDEALDEAGVGIGFWGEGADACESVGGVEEAFELVEIGGSDGVFGMCAAVAVEGADEGAFDVESGDDLAGEGVLIAEFDDALESAGHFGDFFGDDGCEYGRDAVGVEGMAGGVELIGGEVVLVEIDAGVAVDL